MTTMRHGGGLRIDPHQDRFARLCSIEPVERVYPARVDSIAYCLPADDQGRSDACAGFATAGWCEAINWQSTSVPVPINAFEVYEEAKTDDPFPGQPGTTIEAAFRACQRLGHIPSTWLYFAIRDVNELRYALHKWGVACLGFNIDETWNVARRDDGRIPDVPDAKILGGHAVLACWYDAEGPGVQNSWGRGYGRDGFCRFTWSQAARWWLGGGVMVPK